MGGLAGFKYREVARPLRTFGFVFDRQGPGSHEIWRHLACAADCSSIQLIQGRRLIALGASKARSHTSAFDSLDLACLPWPIPSLV